MEATTAIRKAAAQESEIRIHLAKHHLLGCRYSAAGFCR
jgi:hypothetical protein